MWIDPDSLIRLWFFWMLLSGMYGFKRGRVYERNHPEEPSLIFDLVGKKLGHL